MEPARVVCDLGVPLDDELSMKQHISKVASTCFYHQLRWLRQLRWLLSPEVTARLVSAFIMSRVDYCNSVLAGLPLTIYARATCLVLQNNQQTSSWSITLTVVVGQWVMACEQAHIWPAEL